MPGTLGLLRPSGSLHPVKTHQSNSAPPAWKWLFDRMVWVGVVGWLHPLLERMAPRFIYIMFIKTSSQKIEFQSTEWQGWEFAFLRESLFFLHKKSESLIRSFCSCCLFKKSDWLSFVFYNSKAKKCDINPVFNIPTLKKSEALLCSKK